jgi:hypothetical protein
MDADNPHDSLDAVELLTYSELGQRRGISRASAERLARRHKWKRVLGNDGVARVAVPPDAAALVPDDPGDKRAQRVDPVPALRAAVETLRDQLRREGDRADKAEARADRLETAMAGQSALIAAAEERAKQSDTAAQEAGQRAERLAAADAARRARGRWARLKAAWKGE